LIIPTIPRPEQMFSDIWKPLVIMFLWDVAVTCVYFAQPDQYTTYTSDALSKTSLTLFGTVVALFLGFRSNSAYARWWEGRMMWGLMINASRNINRCALNFIGASDARARALRDRITVNQAAYVHVLRCQLRGIDRSTDAYRLLAEHDATRLLGFTNAANAIMNDSSEAVAQACKEGYIDTMQQSRMEAIFIDILDSQGGMERIKKTPLPMQYRLFPQLFVRVFCVLLPIGIVSVLGWATPIGSTLVALMFLAALRIGDDLVDPFANTPHDLPLLNMCTTIEIDMMESISRPAPEQTEPIRGVLW